MSIQINLEIGHEASIRTKNTPEGFTHDWEVFVRGCEGALIQYYIDKVVFNLHETFEKPRRVVKEPPYSIKTSGYAGFNLPIEIYLKNSQEPKKIKFNYDLHLQPTGPPICKVQKEKYIFSSISDDFKSKLLKGGAQVVSSSAISQDINDSHKSEEKNQMTSKPKLSGSDIIKKHKKFKEPCTTEKVFINLFGPPITKTSKIVSEAPKSGDLPKITSATSDKTIDKNKSKSQTKDKERERDKYVKQFSSITGDSNPSEKNYSKKDTKKSKDKSKDREKKEKSPRKDKEKSRENEKSPPNKPQSPCPKSPKRPPSPPPNRHSTNKEREDRQNTTKEKERSRQRKEEKKIKKEKSEHKENKHKDRSSTIIDIGKPEYKEHTEREKKIKESREKDSSPVPSTTVPMLPKFDKKEKSKDITKDSTTKDVSRSDKKNMSDKTDEKSKHKHKKSHKSSKDKDEAKSHKYDKKPEHTVTNPILNEEKEKSQSVVIKDSLGETNNLFENKNNPPIESREEKSHPLSNLLTSLDECSSVSSRNSSRAASPVPVLPPDPPTSYTENVKKDKIIKEQTSNKKDKSEKWTKNSEDYLEKKRKRKNESVERGTPLEKVWKEDSLNNPSDDERKNIPEDVTNSDSRTEAEEYMDVLRNLQHKIMGLKDTSDLEKIVQLISETGRFEISAHTFDFDLCLLDRTTVKHLQDFLSTI